MKQKIRKMLATEAMKVIIGVPLGVLAIQPVLYNDTYNMLEKIAQENSPEEAKDLARTLAIPSKNYINKFVGYGLERATRDYLSK